MLMNCKKNTCYLFTAKMLLAFLLLFCSAPVHAQSDYDTVTAAVDTAAVEDIPPPQEDYDDDTDQKDNFLKTWEYNSDTLQVQQRKLSDSLVKKMQSDKDYWYANKEFEKEKKKEYKNSGKT